MKIDCSDREFHVNGDYTVCVISSYFDFTQFGELNTKEISKIMQKNKVKKIGNYFFFTTVGKSKCHPDDDYDAYTGEHIAESRAKAKVGLKLGNLCASIYKVLEERVKLIGEAEQKARMFVIGEEQHVEDLIDEAESMKFDIENERD